VTLIATTIAKNKAKGGPGHGGQGLGDDTYVGTLKTSFFVARSQLPTTASRQAVWVRLAS
jgi:hypothetical protein